MGSPPAISEPPGGTTAWMSQAECEMKKRPARASSALAQVRMRDEPRVWSRTRVAWAATPLDVRTGRFRACEQRHVDSQDRGNAVRRRAPHQQQISVLVAQFPALRKRRTHNPGARHSESGDL